MTDINTWATRWGIPAQALTELTATLAGPEHTTTVAPMSEAAVQQQVRLIASYRGVRLFRNNNGACKDDKGRQIRYGLANDSAQVNAKIKSSDLIGITPIMVTPDMVGQTLGVFTSIECKRPGWKYTGKGREAAQMAWLTLVASMGGIGRFVSDASEY